MSYSLTVEPAIMDRARECATRKGLTIDAVVSSYLVSFVKMETEGERLSHELDAFIAAQPRLVGEPYKLNRADAYAEERSRRPRIRIGSMRDELSLPPTFDEDFDAMDKEIASEMMGV